jgi:hypothetical protein
MQKLIYDLGCKRANDEEIRKSRFLFNIGEIIVNDTKENIIETAKEKLKNNFNLDLTNYNPEIIERDNAIGFYLNWHIDDCAVFKHDQNLEGEKTNNVPLDEKYSLFHMKCLPRYTMIIYLTSIDDDFIGGEFEFVDQLIRPKKYDVVVFDSREVHRVRRFRGGIRKNILIKFFEKTVK